MQIISTITALRHRLRDEESVAFVPTMGNLHEGHLDLVRVAREHGRCVVVSIFVNPLQFGVNEDFSKYPRTLEQDCKLLEQCGVDVVFAPSEQDLYTQPQQVMVDPPAIANELCGAFRSGHFRGVATVVLKLFNIVQPQVAVFGKKDYQQLHIVRQMVAQLNLPIEIIGSATVRAADGLALSSRNQYLNLTERTEAAFLCRTLANMGKAMRDQAALNQAKLNSLRDFSSLEQEARDTLSARGWEVEYIAIRRSSTLLPLTAGDKDVVILTAAWLGKTRLIDNLEMNLQDGLS
ncbi:MAG: pantoate--beta-alanine ligase [Candidatus Nitrotoga sp.]